MDCEVQTCSRAARLTYNRRAAKQLAASLGVHRLCSTHGPGLRESL